MTRPGCIHACIVPLSFPTSLPSFPLKSTFTPSLLAPLPPGQGQSYLVVSYLPAVSLLKTRPIYCNPSLSPSLLPRLIYRCAVVAMVRLRYTSHSCLLLSSAKCRMDPPPLLNRSWNRRRLPGRDMSINRP